MTETVCDYCGDSLEGEGVQRGDRAYCCEACAFEAGRSKDCGGRGDAHLPQSTTETLDRQA